MPSGQSLSTLTAILKDFYLPPVVEQLNNEVLLCQRLESRTQELYGNQAIVPVHTNRSTGIGARGEGEVLPDAGNQVYDKALYDLKYLYGRVRVTGPSMAKTASEAGAFLKSLKSELDGIRNDLKKDLARQVYGNGDGVIAATTAAAGVTVIPLASAEALKKGQLYVNMLIDIGDNAGNTQALATARTITAVNPATPSITISGAVVTTTVNHRIFRAGASAATKEIAGLQQIVPTAANTFGGINAASAAGGYWDNLRDTTGGALNMDKLMQAFNRVRISGGETSLALTSFGIQRAYFNLFTQTTKYTEPLKLEGGFTALEFMGKPFVADVDAPFGNLYLLDERFLKVFNTRDWHFLDEDGNILKWTSGYDMWEAVLARYMNLGATRRNCQMVLSGITVGGSADPGF